MAEQNLGNAIELLRTENAKQSQEQVSSTDKINVNLEKFFKQIAAMAGDREEERRDKKKEKKDKPEGAVGFKKSDITGGFGLPGMISGILAAVTGFAVGVVDAFKRLLSKLVPKSIKNAFKNLSNAFKAGTNGVKGLSKAANGAFRSLNTIEKGIRALGVGFQFAVDKLKSAGKFIKGNFLKAVNGIKSAILFLAKPFGAINRALGGTQGGIGFLSKASATIGEFFKGIGTKIKGFTDLFGKSGFLGKIFTVFRVLGTKIPIIGQIIAGVMAIFDGFSDAAKEVGGFGSKIIRFLTSGIGTFFGVVVGGIGDLVKWAVSKLAGLFGLDKISTFLDSFSFEEIIIDMYDSVGTYLIGAFTGGFDNFMSKLPTMIKTVLDYTIFAIPTLLSKAAQFIGDALGFDMSMLDGFSPTQYLIDMMATVTKVVSDSFNWIVDKVTNFDFGAALGAALDWGHEMMMKLKGIIAGILPDADSWAGKLIPDAVYDYVNETPPKPVEKAKEEPVAQMDLGEDAPDALTQKDVIGISAEEQASNVVSLEDARTAAATGDTSVGDDLDSISVTPKEQFIKDMEDPQWMAEAAEKRKKREEDFAKMEEESKKTRLTKEEKFADLKERRRARAMKREEKYLEMKKTGMKDGKKLSADQLGQVDRSLERIEAIKKYRGRDVDSMSRENARSSGGNAVTVVAPSSQNVTNNTNQSTAAIMSQNQPTVDQNDRTYAVA